MKARDGSVRFDPLLSGAIVVFCLACTAGNQNLDEAGASTESENVVVKAGQTVSLRGVVVENVRACEVDGPCYLVLRTPTGSYTVVYAEPRGRACSNGEAARAGFELAVGDAVEVRAWATSASRLTTCDSPDSFIRETARASS